MTHCYTVETRRLGDYWLLDWTTYRIVNENGVVIHESATQYQGRRMARRAGKVWLRKQAGFEWTKTK